ncbi:D-alanine--D-alanine ligase family protein [Fimbriiglobus ruber]|uniref:D-alanine-D-alanine ligase and related ATP-grasp enzymes-like n=1 Tax=Fimbriiglobus ruber TaxID=1908690 RepID=A0A225DRZ2_9BACT|nr:hypothetical protein [Fimbriiglobus ruber]OWK39155.1 D-alanine-D-alanine ligase and related ATP-grasp enzymes-like [Fimbriiglobus ruber]
MAPPRVLVLFNEPVLAADHPDADAEHDVIHSVNIVTGFLEKAGLPVTRLGVSTDPTPLVARLKNDPPDVVFNLFEGTADHGNTEAFVAGIMEWLAVPFTGSPAQAMTLARNKLLAKHLFIGAGIETPAFFAVEAGEACPANTLGWPVIVKPAREDASVGIDQGAVVTTDADLRDRVEYILARYGGPVLVEQFIVGREMHVTLVELDAAAPAPTALPFSEILFQKGEDDHTDLWPIYSYDAKWRTDSSEYHRTPVDVPVVLPEDVTGRLVRAAQKTYRLLGCRDYARVDARVTDEGKVYILEANPNPSITSIMLRYGLEAIGWTHDAFVAHVAKYAAARGSDWTVPRAPVTPLPSAQAVGA